MRGEEEAPHALAVDETRRCRSALVSRSLPATTPAAVRFNADPCDSGAWERIGMQVISTMVGYPLGGIIVGFVLDKVFHTAPWIMLGLMFAAFAGACLHVVQMNKNNAR